MALNKKVEGRQDTIRRWLLDEMGRLPHLPCLGKIGDYAMYRWYRFAQLAMFRDGLLLDNDENWAIVKKEIDDWPMMLWLSLMDTDLTQGEAKAVYNGMTSGRFTVTQPALETDTRREWRLVQMGWVQRGIRGATRLQIWQWLGPVGGEYPAAPEEESSQ